MKICDNCGKKKVRRLVKVKDVLYGKGFVDYDLCEVCYQGLFKPVNEMKRRQSEEQ